MGTESLRGRLEAVEKAWESAPAYVKLAGQGYMTPVMALLVDLVARVEALEGGTHGN